MVAPECRPPRDSRIEDLVSQLLTNHALFSQNIGYAGDDENPRPLPQLSLADWKRYTEFLWQNARRSGFAAIPSALYFAFYNSRYAAEEGATISLPADHLSWLAAPGDHVLLSDGIVHHYTTIAAVDHTAIHPAAAHPADPAAATPAAAPAVRRISFIDPWPDRFFLKEGLNMAGIAAVPFETMPGLSITIEEFERVIVGLETLDTPDWIESYLDAFPQQRSQFRFLTELGLALLDAEREDLAPTAAAYFDHALFAALMAQPHERQHIAAYLYLALGISLYKAQHSPDPTSAKPFQDRLYRLLLDHTEPTLLNLLPIEKVCRLANAAGWAQQFERSAQLFSLALERDPRHIQARQLRAAARFHQQDFPGAIEDSLVALDANAQRLAELQIERDALDPRGSTMIEMAEQRLAGQRSLRASIYGILTSAYGSAGNFQEAEQHALAWQSLSPNDPSPLSILALVHAQKGEPASARELFQRAAELEPDPTRKAQFLLAAEQLPAQTAPPSPPPPAPPPQEQP